MAGTNSKIESGMNRIKDAIQLRNEINEEYLEYRKFASLACQAVGLEPYDFKRAVDGVYYFGGGWPSPKSKGRLESLLDNFVNVYMILDFAGMGDMVTDHLAKYGMTISMNPENKLKDAELSGNEQLYIRQKLLEISSDFSDHTFTTLSELVLCSIMNCVEIQGTICKLADECKEVSAGAQNDLEVEDQEFKRLFNLSKNDLRGTEKAIESNVEMNRKIKRSLKSFSEGSKLLHLP